MNEWSTLEATRYMTNRYLLFGTNPNKKTKQREWEKIKLLSFFQAENGTHFILVVHDCPPSARVWAFGPWRPSARAWCTAIGTQTSTTCSTPGGNQRKSEANLSNSDFSLTQGFFWAEGSWGGGLCSLSLTPGGMRGGGPPPRPSEYEGKILPTKTNG